MTEITIYKIEDGNEFYDKAFASSYEDDYNHLKRVEQKYLGDRLNYPGYCQGPCLETKHHDVKHLNQVFMECLVRIHTHNIEYLDKYDTSSFDLILSTFQELQVETEQDKVQQIWNRIVWYLERLSRTYYFGDELRFSENNNIIKQVIRRLKNTSYLTGTEYPDDSNTYWVTKESEWEAYVQKEKEYQEQGGKYR